MIEEPVRVEMWRTIQCLEDTDSPAQLAKERLAG